MADTLSRLPVNYVENIDMLEIEERFTCLHHIYTNNPVNLDYKVVASETPKDKTLAIVKRMTLEEWPERKIKSWPKEIRNHAYNPTHCAETRSI